LPRMGSPTRSSRALRIAVTAALVLALAAGGTASSSRSFSVCLVTDAGSFGDAGLARSAEAGLHAAERTGVDGRVIRSTSVGAVGGLKIPPVDSYIAGFEAGAKRAFPGVRTSHRYAQSLTNEAKCRTAAISQIEDGALVEFQVAGRCGLGILSAARARGVFGLGSDSDQSSLGRWVMTSAVKRVDVAVASVIRSARSGSLRT